ncbi:NigD-like C-terminal domain-containing protein [uncultured Bacteroides sp.]|uniref:NigD1/NigD2 family lipoprotein n=1 Tax=uncultured Bacteroides sp. TaxID=162156 RepID=UPI002AA942FF|nr:NigD-like C-terminal domain-containing protein [uncultured Bacteroides sp.]
MRISLRIVLFLIPLLLSSCGDDDGYVYPSVKLEFLTAEAGADGSLSYLITDSGEQMQVAEDLSLTKVDANSMVRVVANYETLVDTLSTTGMQSVKIYALLQTISPEPLPAANFGDSIKTDPVEVQSMWMGRDYLNMTLLIKTKNGQHRFHFVEDWVSLDAITGRRSVYLSLYHDAGSDSEAFTKRAYLSVPLSKYAGTEGAGSLICFSVNTYDEGVKTYCFDYTPSRN